MIFALQPGVMVRVVEEPVRSTTVADVLIGVFGLTGALVLVALVLGGILGGALIGVKKFREKHDLLADAEACKITYP
ncbi:MAG TPA: hypothetical protein VM364_04945 [Vicinamibacterales bacterium]|nr:hypothetical protein [Vicinamibacterales bacterium]